MERRLLITVSDDPEYLYGVRFVSTFFRNKRDLKLTLLHVAPHFESMDAGEALRMHEMDRTLSEIYARKGRQALQASERILLNEDFSSHQIRTRLTPKHHGMMEDIIDEANREHCDAIVLGRRGYAILEKVLHPWLSEATMDLSIDFPLWICRRPERGLQNVLLCVDGSEPALRMAEHLGVMVGREDHHLITLLHVGDEKDQGVDQIIGTARQKLLEGGVLDDRVQARVVQEPDVAAAVRREASQGRYAVVAVGRRGLKGDATPRRTPLGSKSLELLQTLERSTLWVSR